MASRLVQTDYMYISICPKEENFTQGKVTNYGNIALTPAAGVLSYAQGLIEGLKAYRRDDGRIQLFRPEENALRMKKGADRMLMPSPSVELFVDAIKRTVLANKHWVPSPGNGSLYIRPLLIGSGEVFALQPASEFAFLVYVFPLGNIPRTPLNLLVEEKIRRATPGGVGDLKSITNYSPVFQALAQAKAEGFSDILFLDAVNGKYIEELSGSNIFMVKGNVVSTPAVNGTILPGITRSSILMLALDSGYEIEERTIAVEELFDAEEVFCSGTAVGIVPVGNITFQGRRIEYKNGNETVSQKLYNLLTGIQSGRIEDNMGWTVEID